MLYEALILVCLISTPEKCITLADIRGPYETRDTCVYRAYEMAAELITYMPKYEAKQYMCLEQEPIGTTA